MGMSLADLLRAAVQTYCTQDPSKGKDVHSAWHEQLQTKDTHIAHLSQELTETRRAAEESSKRSDTIIMHLAQQLDRAHLQLEDVREHRSVWQRIKAAFMTEVKI